jgi:hypothetical protein
LPKIACILFPLFLLIPTQPDSAAERIAKSVESRCALPQRLVDVTLKVPANLTWDFLQNRQRSDTVRVSVTNLTTRELRLHVSVTGMLDISPAEFDIGVLRARDFRGFDSTPPIVVIDTGFNFAWTKSLRIEVSICDTDSLVGWTTEPLLVHTPSLAELTFPPATFTLDPGRGNYMQNPSDIVLGIINTTQSELRDVRTRLEFDPKQFYLPNQQTPVIAYDTVQPGARARFAWTLIAVPQSTIKTATLAVVLTTANGASLRLARSITLPSAGIVYTTCDLSSSVDATGDTLHFIPAIDDYRDAFGTRSSTGLYNVFVVEARVRKTGSAAALDLSATVLPSEELHVDEGDVACKNAGNLPYDSTVVFQWKLRPYGANTIRWCPIDVVVTAANQLASIRRKVITLDPAESRTGTDPAQRAPGSAELRAVYPHPVRATATITYAVSRRDPVRLTVFDMLGRERMRIDEGERDIGTHVRAFNTGGLESGCYLVRLTAGSTAVTQPMIVMNRK